GAWQHVKAEAGSRECYYQSAVRSISGSMLDLARRYPDGILQIDSITAQSTKCPVKGRELRQLALAAWCEACGVPFPAAGDLTARRRARAAEWRQLRQEMLAEMRGGRAGVERWNRRSAEEREAVHFRRVDLSGAKLRGANLRR